MDTNTQETRRSRRLKGAFAGLAGACLLLGGTFSLWSASDSGTGGTINTGNLDIAAVGAASYFDVSSDRTDATAQTPVTGLDAHDVPDITSYHIVPGDRIEANYGFSVALEGDNLVGELSAGLAGGFSTAEPGVTFTAQAFVKSGGEWVAVSSAQEISAASGATVDLGQVQAANESGGTDDAGVPVIDEEAVGEDANVVVVVTGDFDSSVTSRDFAQALANLGNVTVDLQQVRG